MTNEVQTQMKVPKCLKQTAGIFSELAKYPIVMGNTEVPEAFSPLLLEVK